MLKGAPFAFAICLLAGGLVGYSLRGQEVANLESLVRLKDERIEFSTDQLRSLQSTLRQAPASVTLYSDDGARAEQISEAFHGGGWAVDQEPLFNAPQPPQTEWTGVLLAIPDNEAGRTARAAFDAADVPYTLEALPPSEAPQVWLRSE